MQRSWVEPEQLMALIEAADETYRPVVARLAGAGLPVGEAVRLRDNHRKEPQMSETAKAVVYSQGRAAAAVGGMNGGIELPPARTN